MDKLAEKAVDYLNAFEQLTKQYAPDVVSAALTVVQINMLQKLVWAIVGAAVIFMLWRAVVRWLVPLIRKDEFYEHPEIILPGVVGMVAGMFSFSAAIQIFDMWVWVGIFQPKLYIAYKIFAKIF